MAKKTKKSHGSLWIVKNLGIALVAFLVLVFGTKWALNIGTNHNDVLEVPDFRGMTFENAQKVADQAGVRLEVVDSVYTKTGRGLVRGHTPSAGSYVKEGRRVLVTVNAKGVRKVQMTNLIGYSTRQAIAELNTRGLSLGRLVYTSDIATNNVLKQRYRGRDVEPGEMVEAEGTIDLVVGLNSDNSETTVPDVSGLAGDEAVRRIHDHYLNVRSVRYDRNIETFEDSLKAVVYKQTPDASELPVKMGTDVTLYLRVELAE